MKDTEGLHICCACNNYTRNELLSSDKNILLYEIFDARSAEHSLYSGECLYIFYPLIQMHVSVMTVRPLRFAWLLVIGLYTEDY